MCLPWPGCSRQALRHPLGEPAGFSEAFPKVDVFADLFEVDQNIYTCAGGTAALDMMLKLIGDDFDENLVNRVANRC